MYIFMFYLFIYLFILVRVVEEGFPASADLRENPHDRYKLPLTSNQCTVESSCKVDHLDYFMLIIEFDSERVNQIMSG